VAGSYTFNGFFGGDSDLGIFEVNIVPGFPAVSDVAHPALTLQWADGSDWIQWSSANRFRAKGFHTSNSWNIPRHGSRPTRLPEGDRLSGFVREKGKLPGAINVAFADGHVEQVPLENLWKMYFHKNYVPPNGWGED